MRFPVIISYGPDIRKVMALGVNEKPKSAQLQTKKVVSKVADLPDTASVTT